MRYVHMKAAPATCLEEKPTEQYLDFLLGIVGRTAEWCEDDAPRYTFRKVAARLSAN